MTIKSVAFIYSFLFFIALQSQNDAILWKISGNGIVKPSYIFGTIHAHCNKDKFNTTELNEAIRSSDIIAMELDLNDFGTFVALMKSTMRQADRPISSFLKPLEYKSVDSACKVLLKDSLKNLDNKTPMALMGKLFLSEPMISCIPLPIDFLIAEIAKQENKQTIGLESFEFQDSLLNSIPDSIQIQWLVEFSRNIGKTLQDFELLLEAYEKQQSQSLYDLSLKTSPEMMFLKNSMLDQRNRNWMNFLKDNFQSNSYFVAVGAAHLGGENGMLSLLMQAGYTLTPVQMKF